MSSFKTQAFVAEGDFGPATRDHPALVFGEEATKVFDSRDHSGVQELALATQIKWFQARIWR
ncbi:hypothetical protein CLAFUW4_00275 [Fulvia fulva]|uniref:uncharacterized protein n=1 Tax=Passalora fulva TaxID=5499 RepID=UPI00285286C2|nr:uncharacterized protein CLAFUR5_20119 [Fulvia fulva]KAK4635466.1 hypothetical protein CLAFUR4_00275 [Fulvia fulva]KAK4638406.1 hypothetical protein CLAFUR0_00276 [Fulvia fulva]WMI38745.1 hypothetical protein CLAFUR5_20119 [Fulvia fulva]WPV09432.1 hypothetical protein CLAFUW4_00275 [Fulvia fulva]WPV23965.1 hypothetical protein CLAFUW7_00279 [Fulvia fulva]